MTNQTPTQRALDAVDKIIGSVTRAANEQTDGKNMLAAISFQYCQIEGMLLYLQTIRTTLQAREWKKIDSAPKDGTMFIGYFPDLGFENFQGRSMGNQFQFCWYGKTSSGEERFLIYGVGAFMEEIIPTHWMPLPPPPASEGE